MIGEKIDISKVSNQLLNDLVGIAERSKEVSPSTTVISFYGESGSGKSVTAHALEHALEKRGHKVLLFQMDDYFKLPPKLNSQAREKDINHVGPQEVDLELLDNLVLSLKNGQTSIKRPIINFIENTVSQEQVELDSPLDFVIVEGTYLYLLKNDDIKFFIERTYQDTHVHRVSRMREPHTELIQKALEIEHSIISVQSNRANYIISKDFQLK